MPSKLRIVFWLDVSLLLSICAVETVPFTGMLLHEWLGLALAGMVVVHLLLSWTWIDASTRRFIRTQSNRTRFNYILNLCLFADVVLMIFSGIAISQKAVPALTRIKAGGADLGWEFIHNRLSDSLIILAGLHLAINWDWSLAAARKILSRGKAQDAA